MTICISVIKNKMIRSSFFLVFASLFGCASKPVLRPNAKLQNVDEKKAQEDISYCEDVADKQLSSLQKQRNKKAKKSYKARNVWAIGAISGVLKGDNSHAVTPPRQIKTKNVDKTKKNIITKCLTRKGHRVLKFD